MDREDKMNYSNILEQLLFKFPELKKDMDDNDYLQDLPHCFFDIILVGYIISACKNGDKNLLVRAGEFFEQMALCDDENVRELLNVSLLEPLVLEKENVIPILKNYFGKETLKELKYWLKRYNKF